MKMVQWTKEKAMTHDISQTVYLDKCASCGKPLDKDLDGIYKDVCSHECNHIYQARLLNMFVSHLREEENGMSTLQRAHP